MNEQVLKIIENGVPVPRGHTAIFTFNSEGRTSDYVFQRNKIMDAMADINAKLLGGDPNYRVGYMYMEYENLASAEDNPTIPAFSKSDTVTYFINLSSSPVKDFLRVPIYAAPGYSATSGSYTNNMVTFYAVTSNMTEGFWGRSFTAAANSAVYGGALVSAPQPTIQANDLIACRNYPEGTKVIKPEGEQIAMVWSVEFLVPTNIGS